MKRLEARFRVVTPCFIGASEGDAALRPPSIKGALRFWWRTLAYAACAGKGGGSHAIRHLRRQEDELFGSSEMGQSPLTMRLGLKSSPRILEKGDVLERNKAIGPGARYLGYGVMNAGRLTRPCFAAPFEFMVRIGAKDAAPLRRVQPALHLLGLAGGLGARSRKGYGSVNLIALEGDCVDDWEPPRTVDEYRDRLHSLLDAAISCDREPEISAFSSGARMELMFEDMRSPMEVLDEYGKAMVRYRSWGRKGKILNNERSRCPFPEDHGWMTGKKTARDFHPRRAVFGLPHNYGKGIDVKPQCHGRRASPLLFHVQQIGDHYAGIALLLRSRFLPEGEKILARNRAVPANPDWSVLTEFLDDNGKRRIWPDD